MLFSTVNLKQALNGTLHSEIFFRRTEDTSGTASVKPESSLFWQKCTTPPVHVGAMLQPSTKTQERLPYRQLRETKYCGEARRSTGTAICMSLACSKPRPIVRKIITQELMAFPPGRDRIAGNPCMPSCIPHRRCWRASCHPRSKPYSLGKSSWSCRRRTQHRWDS